MTPNEYQKFAIITESRVDHELFADRARAQLHDALELAAVVGKILDAHKRHLFYGVLPKNGDPNALLNTLEARVTGARSFTQPATCDILKDPRVVHGIVGVLTEGGELAEALGASIELGAEIDRENIVEECGDVLWYVAVLLDAIGVDLETVMEANIEKLKKRYGEKFTAAAAVARADKL